MPTPRVPWSLGHAELQTLLNSTGLNTSMRSENSFWMLLKRLVSMGALREETQSQPALHCALLPILPEAPYQADLGV